MIRSDRTRRLAGVGLASLVALLVVGCGDAAVTQQPPTDDPTSRPFTVYTHCGVESARIDGRWWHAEPPLYNRNRTGPPAGWGDPYQEGTLTLESPERAVFEAKGRRVVFVPAPDDQPVRLCM